MFNDVRGSFQDMKTEVKKIIQSPLLRKLIENLFGKRGLETITRPACYVLRTIYEDSRLIKRIIILPPQGFTSDEIDLLNPHPETRNARIKILGKINPYKKGFKPLVREVEFNYSLNRIIPTEKNSAYAKFGNKYCGKELKSWKNWFYVVKENGWGNFHSLINLSDEWVVIILEKELVDQKQIEIEQYLGALPKIKSKKLLRDLKKIEKEGDKIFQDKKLINEIMNFPFEVSTPILIQMLNSKETGKHEPCSFFALILKIARKNRNLVSREIKRAVTLKLAPSYYLEDLNRKISKY